MCRTKGTPQKLGAKKKNLATMVCVSEKFPTFERFFKTPHPTCKSLLANRFI